METRSRAHGHLGARAVAFGAAAAATLVALLALSSAASGTPADTEAPTAPGWPAGPYTEVIGDTVTVRWSQATDDTAVAGYRVTLGGQSATVGADIRSTAFTGVRPGAYQVRVFAFDGAGNESADRGFPLEVLSSAEQVDAVDRVAQIAAAIESFVAAGNRFDDLGGFRNLGSGWFGYQGGVYERSIASTLINGGYLDASFGQGNYYDFMVYKCGTGADQFLGVFSYADMSTAPDPAGPNPWTGACPSAPFRYAHPYYATTSSVGQMNADATAPSKPGWPTGAYTEVRSDSVTVRWAPSTDDVAVTAYRVTLGSQTGLVDGAATSYTFNGVDPGVYLSGVFARDAAGNESAGRYLRVRLLSEAEQAAAPADTAAIAAAVELFVADGNGFADLGGSNDRGLGWFDLANGSSYLRSMAATLVNGGYLDASFLGRDYFEFMIYHCGSGGDEFVGVFSFINLDTAPAPGGPNEWGPNCTQAPYRYAHNHYATTATFDDIGSGIDDPPGDSLNTAFAASFGGHSTDQTNGLALSPGGFSYAVGSFQGQADFDAGEATVNRQSNGGSDAFLTAHNPAGELAWVTTTGGSGTDVANGVTVDPSGNVLVVGSFSETVDFDSGPAATPLQTNGGIDAFVASYDNNGSLRWVNSMGGTFADRATAVAAGADGSFYVVGVFEDLVDFDTSADTRAAASAGGRDVFLAKYDADGNFAWVEHIGGVFDEGEEAAVAVDGDDNPVVVGSFAGSADVAGTGLTSDGGLDVFAASFDPAGALRWARSFGGPADDRGLGVAAVPGGGIVVVGSYADSMPTGPAGTLASVGVDDAFALALDTTGDPVWSTSFGGPFDDAATSVAVGPDQSVLIGGTFAGSFNAGQGGDTLVLESAGGNDASVIKLNPEGELTWATSLGGRGNDAVRTVALDAELRPSLAGNIAGVVDLDPGEVERPSVGSGGSNAFLARWERNPFAIVDNTGGSARNGVGYRQHARLSQTEIDGLASGPYNGFSSDDFTQVAEREDNGPSPQEGQFRIGCNWSHIAYDDPIVFPDQPGASHAHLFWGNTDVTAYTTPAEFGTGSGQDLLNNGGSTCQGNVLNRSGYWMPVMFAGGAGPDREVVIPDNILLYYKSNKANEVSRFPQGINLLSGNFGRSNFEPSFNLHWGCYRKNLGRTSSESYSSTIPLDCNEPGEACPEGGCDIQATIVFPQCLNGDLSSADFTSHTVLLDSDRSDCPASHPVRVPQISYLVRWKVQSDAEVSTWRLSSDEGWESESPPFPGGSLHGDWFGAWHDPSNQAWLDGCFDPGPNVGVNNFAGPRNCSIGQTGANGTGRSLVRVTNLNNTTNSGRLVDPCSSCGHDAHFHEHPPGDGFATAATLTQHTLDRWGDPDAVGAGRQLFEEAIQVPVQHMHGFGGVFPLKADGSEDWTALDARFGGTLGDYPNTVLTACCAPAHLEWAAPGEETEEWLPYRRPDPAVYDDYAEAVLRTLDRYPSITHVQVWNEMKGFWNDELQRWDYEAYTEFYNVVWNAVKARHPDVQIGGPYVVLNAYGAGQPNPSNVTGPWGTFDQRDLDVVTYWLENKAGADFIAVDGHAANRDGDETIDRFAMAEKFTDAMTWIRGLDSERYQGADTLPIWWSEIYPLPEVDTASEAEKNALMTHTYIELIKAGAARVVLWGPQGDEVGNSYPLGIFSDTRVDGGGQATLHYATQRFFRDHVSGNSSGIEDPLVDNPVVSVLQTSSGRLLVNTSDATEAVNVDGDAYTLGAYEVIPVAL